MGVSKTQRVKNIEIDKYKGLPFEYGVNDCYSLIMNFYSQELGIFIPKIKNEEGWWERRENLYVKNAKDAGFLFVEDPEPLDILLFTFNSKEANHSAIYLGDNEVLHHVTNRLSTKEPISSFWASNLKYVVRHKDL